MISILIIRPFSIVELVVGGAITLCAHLGATLISDSADVDVDAASVEGSRSTRVLVTGQGTTRDLTIFGYFLLAMAVLCAFYFGYFVGTLVLVAIMIALAYGSRPLLLSGRPIWPQIIWPVLWLIMYALIAHICQSTLWLSGIGYAIFVALFMGVGEGITQDVHDLDNDMAGGRRTTPGTFGLTVSLVIAIAAQTFSLIPWLHFCLRYPMPLAFTALGTIVLVGWLAILAALTRQLLTGYSKTAAQWTHHGSICSFSVINILVISGSLVVR
jgi:4-hydroxybenzoate polyprenyltransferase